MTLGWPLELTAAGLPRPASFDRWPDDAKQTAWWLAQNISNNELQAIQLCALDLGLDFATPHPRAAQAIIDWHTRICPRFMNWKRGSRQRFVDVRTSRHIISRNRLLAAFGWLPAGDGYQHAWLHNADLPDAELWEGLLPTFTLWRLLACDRAALRKTRIKKVRS